MKKSSQASYNVGPAGPPPTQQGRLVTTAEKIPYESSAEDLFLESSDSESEESDIEDDKHDAWHTMGLSRHKVSASTGKALGLYLCQYSTAKCFSCVEPEMDEGNLVLRCTFPRKRQQKDPQQSAVQCEARFPIDSKDSNLINIHMKRQHTKSYFMRFPEVSL